MPLQVRPPAYVLPSYSLTGDLLSFNRCGLQYRLSRLGRLPTTQPVQLWFGEFIHGVLEEAFRVHKERAQARAEAQSLTAEDITDISRLIKKRLAARGLLPRDVDLEELADARAQTVIRELGPHLFPLIHRAEVRLFGARELPTLITTNVARVADRYEMVGIVDVVSHIALGQSGLVSNPIINQLRAITLPPTAPFEVIIDYKGMRRPTQQSKGNGGLWDQYEWQLQTYAELRRKQADAHPVAAGVLLYLNELHPSATDMAALKSEVRNGSTDILPEPGSLDEAAIRSWSSRSKGDPGLSFAFRLRRALRIVPVSDSSIQHALAAFDTVVQRIEECRNKEANGQSILTAWYRNPDEEATCTVCDSRTYCPDFQKHYAKKAGEKQPRLPFVAV